MQPYETKRQVLVGRLQVEDFVMIDDRLGVQLGIVVFKLTTYVFFRYNQNRKR